MHVTFLCEVDARFLFSGVVALCVRVVFEGIYEGCETMDWFQIGKEIYQCCILSPCLFNLYAWNIMGNAKLDEAQAGIKIARRNNNLRYADDTTLMEDSVRTVGPLPRLYTGEGWG